MRGSGVSPRGVQVAPPAVVMHGSQPLPPGPDWVGMGGGGGPPPGAGGLAIRRRGDNTLVLATDRVSRHHARIGVTEGRYWIEDLDSMNGTYVNGEHFSGETRWLSSGDRITVGGEDLRFVAGDATAYGTAP